MDQRVLEMTINYEISDSLTFRSITAATDLEYEWSMDMDESELPVFTNRFGERNEVFQQEFQLLGEADRFNWQAGVFIYDEQPDYDQWTTATSQEGGAPRLRQQNYATDAYAVFAQGTYAVTDRLSVTAGVRYTDEEKSIFSIFSETANPNLIGLSASNSGSWSATTPMVSLAYQSNENLMFYGSLSEGFKGGGLNFNIRPGGENLGILPFDQEEATSLELGVKWNSDSGNMIVNTALFSTELTGQQLNGTILGPGGGFIGIQLNAGESSMTGAEVEFTGNLTDNFQLRATAAIFDGGFDSLGTAASVIGFNSKMPNAPESSYTLGGTYETPLSNGGALGFNFDYSWRDDVQAARNPDNILTLPDLGIFNASLNYHFPGDQLTVTLAGTNLSDEYYFTAFRQRDIQAPFGSTNGNVGRPREVSLSANFQF
jgi:iron complex outermembrane receptor protein